MIIQCYSYSVVGLKKVVITVEFIRSVITRLKGGGGGSVCIQDSTGSETGHTHVTCSKNL